MSVSPPDGWRTAAVVAGVDGDVTAGAASDASVADELPVFSLEEEGGVLGDGGAPPATGLLGALPVAGISVGLVMGALGVEAPTLGVETLTVGVEMLTPGTDTLTLGTDTVTLGKDTPTVGAVAGRLARALVKPPLKSAALTPIIDVAIAIPNRSATIVSHRVPLVFGKRSHARLRQSHGGAPGGDT